MYMQITGAFGTITGTKNNSVPKTIKYSVKLRSGSTQNGSQVLYLVGTKNSERIRINTGIYIPIDSWDKSKRRVRGNSQEVSDLNLSIDNVIARASAIVTHYRITGQNLTLKQFEKEYNYGIPRVNFIGYLRYWLQTYKGHINPKTKKKYTSDINKLEEWRKDITFHDIDETFPSAYRKYCKSINNKDATIERQLRTFKDALTHAKKDKIYFPLDLKEFKIYNYRTNRTYLLPHEVKKFEKYLKNEFTSDTHKNIVAFFLFGCYTGKRLNELKQVSRAETNSKIIQVVSTKTGKKQTMAISPKIKELLNAAPDLFVKTYADATMNKELKKIAKVLKINKSISIHVSRHTFATAWARSQQSIFDLMKILGHSKMETTMNYVHMVEEENIQHLSDITDSLYD